MIVLQNLSLEQGDVYLSALNLEVRDGEIYFMLNRQNWSNDFFFSVLNGFRAPREGKILYDGNPPLRTRWLRPADFVGRVMDSADFETEARIGDWIDFLCRSGALPRANVMQTLMVLGFHEKHLRGKVRELAAEFFKQLYLAICLAADAHNIVINDFIKGAEKSLEMKFNKLLMQKKAAGRSILYLGNDIIYAAEIADRVGFIKNGQLLFEADGVEIKDMDIKGLYDKFLN